MGIYKESSAIFAIRYIGLDPYGNYLWLIYLIIPRYERQIKCHPEHPEQYLVVDEINAEQYKRYGIVIKPTYLSILNVVYHEKCRGYM